MSSIGQADIWAVVSGWTSGVAMHPCRRLARTNQQVVSGRWCAANFMVDRLSLTCGGFSLTVLCTSGKMLSNFAIGFTAWQAVTDEREQR